MKIEVSLEILKCLKKIREEKGELGYSEALEEVITKVQSLINTSLVCNKPEGCGFCEHMHVSSASPYFCRHCGRRLV